MALSFTNLESRMSSNVVPVVNVSSYSDPLLLSAVRRLIKSQRRVADLFIEPNSPRRVVIKPNWVQESHELIPDVWEPVITHPALILAVAEALSELMGGRGTITICDAPHTYANFDAILERGQFRKSLRNLGERFPDMCLDLIDLRREVWVRQDEVVVERRPNSSDPRGYVCLDLGKDSLFYKHGGEGRYYGADYDLTAINAHHRGQIQEYLLAATPMVCDLFVNIPKLKTHKKTGLTCCLKNLVGINGDKNWLPHHTEGTPNDGGDEFPAAALSNRLERWLKHKGRKLAMRIPRLGTWTYRKMRNAGKRVLGDSETVVRNGNWHGNDTCWRMALDLNRAFLYGNPDGTWREAGQARHYFAIVDGIVGGDGNGPLCPDPVASNVLFAGTDPAVVDAVASRLMGFDPEKLPIVTHAFAPHRWPIARCRLQDVRVAQLDSPDMVPLAHLAPAILGGFRPHFGWTSKLCTMG
jgi:uncharacterized protein (DUF362 family)